MTGVISLLLLQACSSGDGSPAWALDRAWLEPQGAGVSGFHTWTLFNEGWESSLAEDDFVCSVVVSLEGQALATDSLCEGCTNGWSLSGHILETDCPDPWSTDPRWTRLTALALGPLGMGIAPMSPFPDESVGGHAAYGGDWTPHGWAYPSSLDDGGHVPPTWDGEQPFTWLPAWAWQLPR
ncbi:MAG: hypothetical protein JXX28_15555 [Deltaproteobacteria bacterium]|nr:hypothetical protein [Deltaproteobacteria bacterium]